VANRLGLTSGETAEPEWWCQHHRKSAQWLVIQIDNLLNGDDPEMTEKILRGSLKAFKETYVEGK
jgi:hypothetical protein